MSHCLKIAAQTCDYSGNKVGLIAHALGSNYYRIKGRGIGNQKIAVAIRSKLVAAPVGARICCRDGVFLQGHAKRGGKFLSQAQRQHAITLVKIPDAVEPESHVEASSERLGRRRRGRIEFISAGRMSLAE